MIMSAPPPRNAGHFCRCRTAEHASTCVNTMRALQIIARSSLVPFQSDHRNALLACFTLSNHCPFRLALPSPRHARCSNLHS